ncbi:TetR/AcrR family transcriptional regulator [Lysobacter enzymogenes]|jgi:AcrR family transcriptional regulator|uniref:TetR/AcrR family transcriptional regulator n=1 Tax=Lysobacter enzymogenes TaxID=69 RepID=UPI0008996C9A|nr:TetR/AcrR family transcriptional regulator [Lysobacter enzymogenes]SDX93947.1 DNA-binding transcriptional regulator, AcrR family [Lysobacter enzymogenes]
MNVPAKRLPKSERREQLLETALAIVREQGTDALTLGYLAERAGVSKPIAYEHFGTRSGLLIALYRRIDERQAATAARDFERTPKRLSDVARLMGESYMSCFRTAGPECHAIFAALKGDEDMERVQRELTAGYVEFYRGLLAPYAKVDEAELHRRCVAIVGAGEALSREMSQGRVEEADAAATLAVLIEATTLHA